jgi:hypothetical protein
MKVNLTKHKEQQKVVNSVDVEDLPEKGRAYCRCWRSNDVSGANFLDKVKIGEHIFAVPILRRRPQRPQFEHRRQRWPVACEKGQVGMMISLNHA